MMLIVFAVALPRQPEPVIIETTGESLYDDTHAAPESELPVPQVLSFPSGPVDTSTFSDEPLDSARTNSTIATICPDCAYPLSGGDHTYGECDRCNAEYPLCTMRAVTGPGGTFCLCRPCALDAEDANEGGCF
jgi:hypothetical protein